MEFSPPLRSGILARRYKRFLADVVTEAGEPLTIHCPNTGAMTGCCEAGSRVWYSQSASPARKYPHTLELVETSEGHLVGINSARANDVVGEALQRGAIESLNVATFEREVAIEQGAGRIDFRVRCDDGSVCLVEVKSVSLALGEGLGAFPDAVSARALRHVEFLRKARGTGCRAMLLFCVQHNGIERVALADDIDPRYAAAVREAARAGVEVVAYRAHVTSRRIAIDRALPVTLDAPQLGSLRNSSSTRR